MAKFRPNLGQCWPKRAIFQISQKNQSQNIFLDCRGQASCKKFGNSNAQFSKKMLKTPIFGYFRPKRPILDHFWPKTGHHRIFREKAKTSPFTHFFLIFQYKKSENSNAQIFGKMGTNVRMNVRTEVNPKVHRLRRETKNQKLPMNQSEESGENLIFMPF